MLYDSSVHIYIYCLKKHIPINSYNHIMLFDFKKDQWPQHMVFIWFYKPHKTKKMVEKNIKIWFVWWIDWITAGWCFGTWVLFFHILGIIFPTDFHIFRRGWNHQPDSNLRSSMISIDTWDHCEESNFTCQYHGVLSYEDHIAKGSVSGAITQYNWDKPGENPESQN